MWFLICEFLDKMWILPQCEMLSKYCEFWVKTPHDSCWKNSSSCIKERKRIFNEMLNFEWHMLKSLCEISFLEFQIVVNISLEKVKEECAFNYPRLSFNLIYYRTLRSLSSSVFLSFFFRGEFRISVWMLCLHSTQPDEIFRCVALRNKMSVKNHLFFSVWKNTSPNSHFWSNFTLK